MFASYLTQGPTTNKGKTKHGFLFVIVKKIVVILCTDGGGKISQREEEGITARIEELLGEKGLIVWWNRSTKTKRSFLRRSRPLPAPAGSIEMPTKGELSTINPKEFTLVLKTRLRRGRISYDESDVRLEGWTACQNMEENLLREWQSTNIAELLVFRENKTGRERTLVIKDFETRMKSLEECIKVRLESFGLITSSGGSVTGTSVTSVMDTIAVTSTSDTGVRSQSHPAPAGSIEMPTKGELSTHVERLINSKEFTLVLKTRLRRGRISYDESDVRLEGWTACQNMEENLLREWQSTNIAELLVFRENKTGRERTLVIKDFETGMKQLGKSREGLLESFGLITSSGGNVIGTSVTSLMDTSAVTSTSDTSVTGLANAGAEVSIVAGMSGLANAGAPKEIGTSCGIS